ncbi:MAG TPA: hypothetical protein VE732_07125, partial [Nitrososphaera sp.]|nr:hypothetical protein [Nitrososphaera sp.]
KVVIHKKQAEEPPDEKRQNLEPRPMPVTSPIAFNYLGGLAEALPPSNNDGDDFEWPEFIDG